MHAELDPTAIGIGLEALLMVRLQRHTRSVIDAFQRHCHELEEIVGTVAPDRIQRLHRPGRRP